MKVINNFSEKQHVIVFPHVMEDLKTVIISQAAGSTHFQFGMKPEQAKEMGLALISYAHELEMKYETSTAN